MRDIEPEGLNCDDCASTGGSGGFGMGRWNECDSPSAKGDGDRLTVGLHAGAKCHPVVVGHDGGHEEAQLVLEAVEGHCGTALSRGDRRSTRWRDVRGRGVLERIVFFFARAAARAQARGRRGVSLGALEVD